VARPGFEWLVAWLCAGEVGAVLCFDASTPRGSPATVATTPDRQAANQACAGHDTVFHLTSKAWLGEFLEYAQ
jgi:hypothetical protein